MSSTRRHDPQGDTKDPPQPADAEVVGFIAQQGIIGQCLREALQDCLVADIDDKDEDVMAHHPHEDDDVSVLSGGGSIAAAAAIPQPRKQKSRLKMKLQPHMVDSVMKRFGEIVAETKWTNSLSSSWEKNGGRKRNEPPAALLKGWIEHYNRIGGKWRIVVEGGQIKRRVGLDRDRRKKVRPPLWEAMGDEETVSLPTPLQLLAYDDLM
jgi:hypothetical protein